MTRRDAGELPVIGEWFKGLRGRVLGGRHDPLEAYRRPINPDSEQPVLDEAPPTPVRPIRAQGAGSRIGRAFEGAGARLRSISRVPTFSRLSVAVSIDGNTIRLLACDGRRVESWASVPF